MTGTVPEDWDDLIETVRRDLEVVANGDPDDEEVRAAIEEVWDIVDAAQERVGSVDVEAVGEVLGVDSEATETAIDAGSIDREFVADDPERAAGLERLVGLINLDGATEYDVGRLWRDPAGPADASRTDEDDSETPDATTDASGPSGDDPGEEIRSQLGDALSQFRDRIQEAREGLDGSSDRAGDTGASEAEGRAEDAPDEAGRGSSSTGRSKASNRRSTPLSTIPSTRRDMGGVPRLSTMPGRGGRSRRSRRGASKDRENRSGSDGEG